MSGTVGAMLNSALQLGSALGLALVISIETNIEKHIPGGASNYKGRSDAFWFVLAVVVVQFGAAMVFIKNDAPLLSEMPVPESTTTTPDEKPTTEAA